MGLLDEIEYRSLVTKYDNFMAPAMVLKVNEVSVSKLSGITISQVNVQLSIDYVCSANFTLEDVYDLKTRSFSALVKKTFLPGSTISIALGYGSSTTMVFRGYIHELSYSFSDAPRISVTALDVRRLMMMNKENRTFRDKSYSEIFNEVMEKYSSVYSGKVVEPLVDKVERMAQTVSDYEFVINELCKKADKEFYVLAGKVYFQTKSKNPKSLITLTWGENLFHFNISRSYRNEEVAVYGIDGKKLMVGKETVKGDGQSKTLMTAPLKHEIVSPNVKDQKGAKTMANNVAEKRKESSKSGSGICIGLPELVPGRYITIANVDIDGNADLKGYVTSVQHSFDDNGFTTEFELGG